MQDSTANPLILALLFVARCLVPVGILLGISYLLRRLGLVQGTPAPPDRSAQPEAANNQVLHGRP